MPVIVCGSEGEWALHENTLSLVGADDKRRGSVQITVGEQMFKAFTGTRDVWVHARLAGVNISSNGSDPKRFFEIRDSSGGVLAAFTEANIYFQAFWSVQFVYNNGSGLTTSAEQFTALNEEFHDYDIRLRISTTTDPDDTLTLDFYRDAQLRFSTVSTDSGGFLLPSSVFATHKNDDTRYDDTYYQDMIVTDSVPTVGMELATLVPSAVGAYSAFTNDYTNIDDFGYDASTVITTSTPTDRESWIFATPTFTLGDKVVYAVAMDTVAQTDLAGNITDFQPFLRINLVDYAGGSLGANNINPDSYVTIFEQNPATSQPWVESDLTGLEAGVLAQ